MNRYLASTALSVTLMTSFPQSSVRALELVDSSANRQTVNLYNNLHRLTTDSVLFGHQNSLAYGYTWFKEKDRSDVRDTTGSYPALYGWDLHDLLESHEERHGQRVTGHDLKRWVREVHSRGGVSTFSWHQANPVTGKSFYDTTPAAATLLPGGTNHAAYKATLDIIADFFLDLDPIPVIFRPYHEHNGDWFWWCKPFVTEKDFIQLWRFTVEYLRDERQVHNLIYAYSPDRSRINMKTAEAEYFYAYPGDDYVDIIGLDNYWDVGHSANKASPEVQADMFRNSLEMIVDLAESRNKLAALTETGADTLPDPEWWSKVILKPLADSSKARRIAYLQVWRNANRKLEQHDHFYVPYPGHPGEADFRRFKESPLILFEDELPPLFVEAGCRD